MNNVSNIPSQGADAGAASGKSAGFDPMVADAPGAAAPGGGISFSEAKAQQEISQIASDPGNSALKLQLAQQGISLTDNSDVGEGERFDSFSEKLGYIGDMKAKLLVAIIMSMVSSGGSPSNSKEIDQARGALKGAGA